MKNLSNAIATVEMNDLLRKDLRTLTDAQMRELAAAADRTLSLVNANPEELEAKLRVLPSMKLYRVVKDADLDPEEARLVRRIAKERRNAGDKKAQRVIDLLSRY